MMADLVDVIPTCMSSGTGVGVSVSAEKQDSAL